MRGAAARSSHLLHQESVSIACASGSGSSLRKERERTYPGDRLVRATREVYTRGIDIDVPRHAVWPWVVQLGLGRAGFYSYELLKRIAGIPVTNAESIEPSMQSLVIGDEIRLNPKLPGIPVADLEVERYICLGVRAEMELDSARPDPERSWSIYLEPASGAASRLVLRGCVGPTGQGSILKKIGAAFEKPIDFVMEQRMLRTIKRLAEKEAGRAA